MDSSVIELLKIFVPSVIALVGVVFASQAAIRAKESVDTAKVAVNTTTELGLKIDGRLEELKKLWQSEANLQGRLDELLASEVRRVAERAEAETKRVAERVEAKEDRTEGALTTTTPATVIPVETRTEAQAAKDSEG